MTLLVTLVKLFSLFVTLAETSRDTHYSVLSTLVLSAVPQQQQGLFKITHL